MEARATLQAIDDADRKQCCFVWFKGGITNICYHCLDRNVKLGNGDKIAFYWEGNDLGYDDSLTYSQLLEKVCQLANYLKDVGVKKGDAVIIYLPMLMELPMTMLACARIGAVHSVVFAGFSADSLAQRIIDCKPKVVLTCNAVRRGSKVIALKDIINAAIVQSADNGVSVAFLHSQIEEKSLEWIFLMQPRQYNQQRKLRMRRAACCALGDSGGAGGDRNRESSLSPMRLEKGTRRLRESEKRRRAKFSIELSREEVELDYLVMHWNQTSSPPKEET